MAKSIGKSNTGGKLAEPKRESSVSVGKHTPIVKDMMKNGPVKGGSSKRK